MIPFNALYSIIREPLSKARFVMRFSRYVALCLENVPFIIKAAKNTLVTLYYQLAVAYSF